jgi:hypothetical protein
MIFHRHKSILIAQRKCAGGSLSRALGLPWDPTPGAPQPEWHWGNGGVLSPEWHAERPDGYHVWSVVRNPWDRFISGWLYCPGTRDIPLRDLLRHLPTEGHDYIHITRLQRDILFDACGKLVAEDLIKFEQLQEGFDAVCDRIGAPRRALTVDNPCPIPRGHHREYLSDPIDLDLFMRHFRPDVEAFGYDVW